MLCGLNLEYFFQTGSGGVGAENELSCDSRCCKLNGKIWKPVLKERTLKRKGMQESSLTLIGVVVTVSKEKETVGDISSFPPASMGCGLLRISPPL